MASLPPRAAGVVSQDSLAGSGSPADDDVRDDAAVIAELREANLRLETNMADRVRWLRKIPMFIYLVDRDGTILHANHTVLARNPELAVGASISMMPVPQHQHQFQRAIEHAIDTGESGQLTMQGGVTGSWYQVNVAVADHDGENFAAVMTLVDVTQLVKTEERLARQTEELARSNAELEKFALCCFTRSSRAAAHGHQLHQPACRTIQGQA